MHFTEATRMFFLYISPAIIDEFINCLKVMEYYYVDHAIFVVNKLTNGVPFE